MPKLVDPRANPSNYRFAVVPYPVLATPALTRFEKLLWALVYSYESSANVDRCHLGVKQAAEFLGTSSGQVRRGIADLERKGFLRVVAGAESTGLQRGRRFLETMWPDELMRNEFMRRRARVEIEDKIEPGGDQTDPHGGDQTDPLGGSNRSPIITPSTPSSTISSRELDESTHVEDDETDEEEDPERAAVRRREEMSSKSKSSRSPKAPKREPSGEEFTKRASARWEFAPVDSPPSRWRSRQLVGYWARSYLARRGVEDPDLSFTNLKATAAVRLLGNVKRFVEVQLNGNWAAAKDAVDAIFERAEAVGNPVSLRYHFTPSSDGALRRLTSRDRKRRGESHLERDDREGSDLEMWKELAEKQRREWDDEAEG